MNPARAASTSAVGKESSARGAVRDGSAMGTDWLTFAFQRKWSARTEHPTTTLIAAATATERVMPRRGIINHAVTKHAAAEPSVLTKYRMPTERPTLPESFTS